MKKNYAILFFIFIFFTLKSQNINMGNGSVVITCPGPANFYDSGGPGSSYNNSEDFTLTVSPSNVSLCLQLAFTTFSTESCCDNLKIYDGNSVAGTLLGTFAGNTIPPTLTSSTGAFTFVWHSDGSIVYPGWAATLNCVTCPPPPAYYTMSNGTVALTCPPTNTVFYDSGGSASNYSNSEVLIKTFTVPAGNCLSLNFTAFSTESCCDSLRIFDGPNTSSPLIGAYSGATSPGLVTASGTSITFRFRSDGSVTNPGWTATISCVPLCSGMPTGGTASLITTPCPPSGSVNITVTGASTAGCGIITQWQSAPALAGPWTNVGSTNISTLTVPTSASTFYRQLISCGASTASSSAVAASSYSIPCSLSTYTAATTTYSFENFVGTVLPTTDDILFATFVNFGFTFCFGGSQYFGGYVASNCAFVLDAVPCNPNILTSTYAAGGAGTGYTIPNPAPINGTSLPRNAILGPWHDINPASTGTVATSRIAFTILGVAPNRRFIVSYENIPMYSTACETVVAQRFTSQIKLFETSNKIEIHVGNKQVCSTWNNGQAVMGLQSFDGTIYIPPVNATAHNAVVSPGPYNQWTMTNTAYKFDSPCAANSGPCVVLPIGFKSFYAENISSINKLTWQTEEERNIKEFIVERSTDAVNFSTIGNQTANNKASTYIYNDNTFKPNVINYYKITAVEYTGERKSTFIIPVGGVYDNLNISEIFPNPTKDKFTISITSKTASNCTLTIKDMFGRELKKSNQPINAGFSQLNISCNELNSGIYFVEIADVNGKIMSQQKLIIGN